MAGNFFGFWYPVDDAEQAADVARNGTWGCAIIVFMIGLPTVSGALRPEVYGTPHPLGFAACAAFVMLGWLIWRLSLTAAIAAMALYAITIVLAMYKSVGILSVIIIALAGLYFVHGVRGTLALRRHRAASRRVPERDAR